MLHPMTRHQELEPVISIARPFFRLCFHSKSSLAWCIRRAFGHRSFLCAVPIGTGNCGSTSLRYLDLSYVKLVVGEIVSQ